MLKPFGSLDTASFWISWVCLILVLHGTSYLIWRFGLAGSVKSSHHIATHQVDKRSSRVPVLLTQHMNETETMTSAVLTYKL